jgi:hypothetical protein
LGEGVHGIVLVVVWARGWVEEAEEKNTQKIFRLIGLVVNRR